MVGPQATSNVLQVVAPESVVGNPLVETNHNSSWSRCGRNTDINNSGGIFLPHQNVPDPQSEEIQDIFLTKTNHLTFNSFLTGHFL